MEQAEVLRIELELDDELIAAWLTCAERYPALGLMEIVKELLMAEAERVNAYERRNGNEKGRGSWCGVGLIHC